MFFYVSVSLSYQDNVDAEYDVVEEDDDDVNVEFGWWEGARRVLESKTYSWSKERMGKLLYYTLISFFHLASSDVPHHPLRIHQPNRTARHVHSRKCDTECCKDQRQKGNNNNNNRTVILGT